MDTSNNTIEENPPTTKQIAIAILGLSLSTYMEEEYCKLLDVILPHFDPSTNMYKLAKAVETAGLAFTDAALLEIGA